MKDLIHKSVVIIASVCLLLVVSGSAPAQSGRGGYARLFGSIPSVTLAQLEEVQQELGLNDEQKKKATGLQEELSNERRDLFQDAAGDFEKLRNELGKLYRECTTKFHAILEEPQQKRSQELFVQVNGPVVLTDEVIAEALQITDEQKQKLSQASDESRAEVFAAFQDLRDMSDDERAKKIAEMIEARDKSLLAVLTDEQRSQFDKMKGEKLEVDLSNLPGPGR